MIPPNTLLTLLAGIVLLCLVVWSWRHGWLKRVLGLSPYGHLPKRRMRLIGPDGESMGDSAEAIAYVSRHGLLGPGITCPCCGFLAARAGEFSSIAQTSWGEAILCPCGRMLMASPDDDVDPVTPGVKYDADVYHRFARPKGYDRVRHKTLKRQARVGDRVVVIDYKAPLNGVPQDLDGTEGQVELVENESAIVRLLGTDGMSGLPGNLQPVPIPLAYLRVMALPNIRKGDRARVVRGDGAGLEGEIVHIDMGPSANALVVVETSERRVSTTIERVEKLYTE
jgi:hypothetical protein